MSGTVNANASTIGKKNQRSVLLRDSPRPKALLAEVSRLEQEYLERKPDVTDRNQLVNFGTSGHRGSPLNGSFTETHILAITHAICDYRRSHGVDGPL